MRYVYKRCIFSILATCIYGAVRSVLCQQTYKYPPYYQQCIEISSEVYLQEMHLLNLINLHLQNTACYVNRLINLLNIINNVLK